MNLWQSTLGHDKAKNFLEESLKRGRLPHALLFVGPSSIGKNRLALALAQRISCEAKKACGLCGPCLRIAGSQAENLFELKAEGSSQIKIDQVRDLIEFFSRKSDGQAKFAIIDNVQKLNPQAANALLKTLEEPPENCYIFMTAASVSAVLPTLRSRVQVVRMAPLSKETIAQIPALSEQLTDPDEIELRNQSTEALGYFLDGYQAKAMEHLQSIIKDTQASQKTSRHWVSLVRDAWVSKVDLAKLVYDEYEGVSQRLSQLDQPSLEYMSQEVLQLESQILGHLDRSLVFESFMRRCQSTLGN